MTIKFLPHNAMKAVQWEITKGHLRSMWALDGAVSTGEINRPFKFEKSKDFIENFIDEFESHGYHEGLD